MISGDYSAIMGRNGDYILREPAGKPLDVVSLKKKW